MRKYLPNLIFIISVFFSNIANSNENIFYIDMNYIMNNSLAGKSIIKQLAEKEKSYTATFTKNESDLRVEEKKIMSQKKLLDKKEFDQKVNLFTQKVSEYRKKRNVTLKDFTIKKNVAQKKIVDLLTPILADYASKNSISFILPKQNIIIGKSELDITKNIIKILDKKIKNVEVK